MARNFVNYVNNSYSGGQNDTDEQDQLLENQAKQILNAYIHKPGAVEKRSGCSALGNDFGNAAVTGLTSWTEDDNTKWQLATAGTSLWYLNSATWTELDDGFTTGLDTNFVVADNKLYVFNGTDNTHSWDGTSTTKNSALTDMDTSIPTGKYAVWWKNYMFVCGASKLSGTSYPSRVWFSNLGDPDTYTTGTDYFDVGLSDGQPITGIGTLDKFLIIFKRRSIYILTGSGPSDWKLSSSVNNVINIENSVGCVSHRSIVQVGDDLWFMSDDGVRTVRKSEEGQNPMTGIVSGLMEGTIAGMNKAKLDKVACCLFNKRFYLAFPNGTSTYNNRCIVAETRRLLDNLYNPHPWVTYTGWQPACWDTHIPTFQPQLYFGNASADSVVVQAETGTSDAEVVGTVANSGAIDFTYISPMIDLRQPDMRKTSRFIIVSAESGGNYDVEVSTSLDGNTFIDHGDINLSSGDLWNTGVWDTATWGFPSEIKEKFALGRASEQIQIKFRNNAADQEVKMYPYTIAIKPKKIK